MKRALILLNMGGPNNLSEVKVFLLNMFKDRRILPIKSDFLRSIIAHIITFARHKNAKENYAKLGGKSPISDTTKSLCEKISSLYGEFSAVDFAMRYTPAFAKDTMVKYSEFDEIILLPLYPHHSSTTILSSLDDVKNVLDEIKFKGEVKIVPEFYQNSAYNDIILNRILSQIKGNDISEVTLIFSAHSLPQSVIDRGDLYEKHVKEHVEILSNLCRQNGLNFKEFKLAYQSKLGPVKWLEPAMSDTLKQIEIKKAIIVPISFCIDNSETDFELAIEYRQIADELGYELYKVIRCPNDGEDFARFLAKLALETE
ncbi:ferrochelatase [Campylobacter sp. 19-13652]|uniref:ferrochelatase n=1 Tax=Campylobacter sp. 19-13652 TaxID=2840180 RepID=UPI001C786AE2|nr:ferrochelatase [Campylobacter sp. 19-13652]BCX79304.1 ferrochelatase [Campylobacter sp. 19-13652]